MRYQYHAPTHRLSMMAMVFHDFFVRFPKLWSEPEVLVAWLTHADLDGPILYDKR